MAYNFNNSKIEQVYEDFANRSKDFESYMDLAFEDIGAAFDEAKDKNEKAKISDDVTYLMSACNDKFANALLYGGEYQEAWAKKFAATLEKAADANPNNIPSILDSAYKLEQTAEFFDYGILNALAKHVIVAHPKYAEKAMETVDKHFAYYDKEAIEPEIKTYKDFYDVYTTAYRKPRSRQMADKAIATANEVYSKMEFIKGGMQLEKSIENIKANPEDEKALQNFEKDLQFAMRVNPEKAIANVVDNLKEIAAVGNADTRNEIYCLVSDAIEKNIPAEFEGAKKVKSDLAFSFIGKAMKTEKDPAVHYDLGTSALGLLQAVATDENGALIMADGKEPQAFGALSKLADTCGHRSELLQILSDTAEKYKDTPDTLQKVKEITIRALDSADDRGVKMKDYEEPDFIKEMRPLQRSIRAVRLRDKEICELLNLEYAGKYARFKFDPSKPLKASKESLLKAANLLGQYKSIDPTLVSLVMNKMDTKGFTNVDDKLLDTFAKVTDRLKTEKPEVSQKYEGIVTEARKQLHTHKLSQKKVNPDAKPPRFEEKREKTAPENGVKKFTIKFDKSDIYEG
jgi:tetratricopeptide (TPR) repeat protein